MKGTSSEKQMEWCIPKIVALNKLEKIKDDLSFSGTENNSGVFDIIRAASCYPGRTVANGRCVNGTHP